MASILSLVLCVPLAILQARRGISAESADGVVVLFAILFALPAAAIALLLPLLRARHGRRFATLRPMLFRTGVALVLAAAWILIVIDQIPCFLGVPNCD